MDDYANYAKAKYRYFLLAFSAAFFVLSLMFLFLMSVVHPRTPDSLLREPETDILTTSYVPTEKEALSVLFVGVSAEESTAESFILVKFDPAKGKVPVIVFPPQTAVQNSGKTEPLSEVFRFGGADYTRTILAETIGVPIDRYVRIRTDAFVAGASAIGTVEYDLPEAVTITRGGAPITLGKGKQLLDGQKVADIIQYRDYPGGEVQRCEIASGLTSAIINQRMDISLSTVVDNVFEKLINMINTDISYTDYYNRKHAAEFLAKVGQNPASPILVSGSWSEGNRLYTLSDTFIALLSQIIR